MNLFIFALNSKLKKTKLNTQAVSPHEEQKPTANKKKVNKINEISRIIYQISSEQMTS